MNYLNIFKSYLIAQNKKERTYSQYTNCLDGMVLKHIHDHIDKNIKTIYELDNVDQLKDLLDQLMALKDFSSSNNKGKNMYSGAFNAYISMLELIQNSKMEDSLKLDTIKEPQQIIFYGAPGTGKSYEVLQRTKNQSVIRTTFHPDTDYSSFVGAYKPKIEVQDVQVVPVIFTPNATFEQNKGTYKEKRINYKFVKQSFLKAYLSAWKKYDEAFMKAQIREDNNSDKILSKIQIPIEPQFLIIEEINRGNCAQIFGDLFQLLDRSENGFSTYPIEVDSDMQEEIENSFKSDPNFKISGKLFLKGVIDNYTSSYGKSLSEDIQEGRVMLLPPNLFIWATMNTSDQSLFPIDSAFKRRWEWKYVKITDGCKKDDNGKFLKDSMGNRIRLGWEIHVKDAKVDWWKFLQFINKEIGITTSSDDKKLGYFFCKPMSNTNIIDEETFVGKVMFYLWNDVFKDSDSHIFNIDPNSDDLSFEDFYTEDKDTGLTIPNSSNILNFLENLVGKENIDKNTESQSIEVSGENSPSIEN